MDTTRVFSVAWDYRCPFARIACGHVLAGLRNGADWDVTFTPHSLKQDHLGDDEPPVWDDPSVDSGLLALQIGVAVRDHEPERFHRVHRALFDARHVEGRDLRDRAVLADVLAGAAVDPTTVFDRVATGEPLDVIRKEHTFYADTHHVWGVPTFVADDRAVFVRLMNEPDGDDAASQVTIERLLDLLTGWPELNEFKHTTRDR